MANTDDQTMTDSTDKHYTGSENLETMLEAVKYNDFLKGLVREFGMDTTKVLDFGAGIGTFTDALDVPAGQITCIEPDPDARKMLTERGYEAFGSLENIRQGAFTYIFSLNVLEHVEDHEAALRRLHELLAAGGTLFLYVPAFNHLRTSMDDLVGHHRRYTKNELVTLVEAAGFEISRAAYTDALGYFATLVFKAVDAFKREPTGVLNKPLLILYDRVFFPISRLLSIPCSALFGKNVLLVARKKSQ
ncbi:MAG: class I SAM-dependent methyltransferase [Gammaproteobacteria bacterium]|nr:class I SAM-dependent methyltransferase [Gammaproteobacteria bacterium]